MYDLENARQRLDIPYLEALYVKMVGDNNFADRYQRQKTDAKRRSVIANWYAEAGKPGALTQDQKEFLNVQLNRHWGYGQITPYEGDDGNRISPIMEIMYGILPPQSQNQESTATMNNSNSPLIERKVYIRGTDAANLSNEQIFSHIASVEAEIEKLEKIKTKPATLQKQIADMQASVQELADFVDQRSGTAAKAAD